MNDSALTTLDQIQRFLDGTSEVTFSAAGGDEERYQHIQSVVRRLRYGSLNRKAKGLVLKYLERSTGYSRQQLTRLVKRARSGQPLRKRYGPPRAGFARRYTAADIALLAETDALHGSLSGPAMRHVMRRAFEVFGDRRFERLARISNGHLYNLRRDARYARSRTTVVPTRSVANAIGQRKAPAPDGRPGFIRIDSVHQGDQDGVKGVYYINAVDCVTQWELVACCPGISERFLLPVIESLLAGFPFRILGFHADNGSEYINHRVAKLLAKLQAEFTKSRPRHSNDNGLAETKNAAIVRKQFGHAHIPQRHSASLNAFCAEHLNPYINFHRPCLFAQTITDAKGKARKRYPQELVSTPYEKLIAIDNYPDFLKEGITPESLHQLAHAYTDNEAAEHLNQARRQVFQTIHRSKTA